MFAQRNMHTVKALKVERTHEENQERAYIAASRRSDRSLEARVESARRASKIHKRRTGRYLRITEQDVLDEEMYEEEDNKLSLQYRRLAAHVQTHPNYPNGKMSAYMTEQVAIKNVVDQAFTDTYRNYPNIVAAPRVGNNQHSIYSGQLPQASGGRVYASGLPATPQQSFQSFDCSRMTPVTPSNGTQDNGLNSNNDQAGPTPQITPSPETSCGAASATSRQSHHPSFPPGSFACLRNQFQPKQEPYNSASSIVPDTVPVSTSSHIQSQRDFFMSTGSNFESMTTLQTKDQAFIGPILHTEDRFDSRLRTSFQNYPGHRGNLTIDTRIPEAMGVQKPLALIDNHDGIPSEISCLGRLTAEREDYPSGSECSGQSLSSISTGPESTLNTPEPVMDAWTSFIDTDQWEGLTANSH
ncbi:hypothetical protein F5884DRAFT_20771 [Xylogone sp. PMI_703]|nr:hypothetical protein F5884DRAFT_20771 [Xylogone sp. PMI_703]